MIEVILLERVERLGSLGQVVKVRPGYARNFLLPQKKALRATKSNIEFFEKQRGQLEAHNAKLRVDSETEAKNLEGKKVVVIRQASEMGVLYGSVSARDIAEFAKEQGLKIERSKIDIGNPIKTLGLFQVRVKLHPEVSVNIVVNVARTEDEARVQAEKGAAVAAKAASASEAAAVEPASPETEVADATEAKPAKKAKKAAKDEPEAEATGDETETKPKKAAKKKA
jgi:large subunit ribosomal protein L9